MSNGDAAPSCPISNSQLPGTPYGQRGNPKKVDIASVPTARDLPSVITAINMMSNIVQHITHGTPQINNTYGVSFRIKNEPPDEDKPEYDRVTWKQIIRDYKDDEVVNPDNKDQVVPIKTIKRIIWQEDTTEQRVAYKGRL